MELGNDVTQWPNEAYERYVDNINQPIPYTREQAIEEAKLWWKHTEMNREKDLMKAEGELWT